MSVTPIEHLHGHNYCIKQERYKIADYIIDQQYADDIEFISNKKHHKESDKKYCSNFKNNKLDYEWKKQYVIQLTEHTQND